MKKQLFIYLLILFLFGCGKPDLKGTKWIEDKTGIAMFEFIDDSSLYIPVSNLKLNYKIVDGKIYIDLPSGETTIMNVEKDRLTSSTSNSFGTLSKVKEWPIPNVENTKWINEKFPSNTIEITKDKFIETSKESFTGKIKKSELEYTTLGNAIVVGKTTFIFNETESTLINKTVFGEKIYKRN